VTENLAPKVRDSLCTRRADGDAAREQGVGAAAGSADHRLDGCAEGSPPPAAWIQEDA
jgi:hypothetical protein